MLLHSGFVWSSGIAKSTYRFPGLFGNEMPPAASIPCGHGNYEIEHGPIILIYPP